MNFKLTLSRWHKVVERINAALKESEANVKSAFTATTISPWNRAGIEDKAAGIARRGAEELALFEAGARAVARIRAVLGRRNAELGISDKLAEVDAANRRASLYKAVLDGQTVDMVRPEDVHALPGELLGETQTWGFGRRTAAGITLQVADGGLGRIGDVLQRMKALAAASLSGVPTDDERAFIDAEYQELINEINGIAETTRFNGESLLDGTVTSQSYFVGTDVSDTIDVDFSNLAPDASVTTFDATGLSLNTEDVTTSGNASSAMGAIDTAIDAVSEARATLGGQISRFEFRGQQIATSLENIDAAKSSIMDVDVAAEQTRLVANQVLVQAGVSALTQANSIPQSLLRVLQ